MSNNPRPWIESVHLHPDVLKESAEMDIFALDLGPLADGSGTVAPVYRDAESFFERRLHEHAREIGVDPERISLWGASAGGMLASLAALVPWAPRVRAAVIWYAVSDFLALGSTSKAPARRSS